MVGGCGGHVIPRCPSLSQGTQSTTCGVPSNQLKLLGAPALMLDSTTRQGRGQSRLLDLPLEIREKIYENVLTTPHEIYLGIVVLEQHRPHHWHEADSLHRCWAPKCTKWGHGLDRTLVCSHRRMAPPYYFCMKLLRVSKQIHAECSRVLYSRNTFAIDLDVPKAIETARCYDISHLKLSDILPLNPAYHALLRTVSFRLYNDRKLTYPVQFFNSVMMYLLRDTPGMYTVFRRRFDHSCQASDYEVFAGWSPTAAPPWLEDAYASLEPSGKPLEPSLSSMTASEAHWNMSMLWERLPNSGSKPSKEQSRGTRLDWSVMSDSSVHAGPWHPENANSRQAARIFLLRPSKDQNKSRSATLFAEQQKKTSSSWVSHWQMTIVGLSRCLKKEGHQPHTTWRKGGSRIRRLFTQPTSFVTRPLCQLIRHVQVRLDKRRRQAELVNADGWEPPLPVDNDDMQDPE